MKRRPRQFTESQLASIAALQTLVDAGAVPTCRLAKGKANMFLDGNPIVYGGAVDVVSGDPAVSDPVVVVDHAGAAVAWGCYNPHSMYRVRILQMAWEIETAEAPNGKPGVRCDVGRVVASRVRDAHRLRADAGLAGSKHTNAYRLINSEGDRLSGVCVDMYGDVAVASVSAAWANAARAEIISAVREVTNATRVAWRIDRKMLALETGRDEDDEDGEDEDDVVTDAHATRWYDASTGEEIFVSGDGDDDDDASSAETEIRENGVAYGVDLARGHKTGFYVDQRDNRAFIRDIAAGKDLVMDVCCYTGGFALNAALGGARRVIGVDSSRPALDIAERNAARNGVTETCEFIRAEAFRHLDACLERGEAGTYDVIVLDPPKFAPNASSLPSAASKYVGLNQRAMRLLRPGGTLITCTCSGAVTQRGLLPEMVVAAAAAAGRRVTMLGAPRGAGVDQPLDPAYPEGNYLTVVVCRVA